MFSQVTSKEQRVVSLTPLPPMQTRPFFFGIGVKEDFFKKIPFKCFVYLNISSNNPYFFH
jgi:hypothetical protein